MKLKTREETYIEVDSFDLDRFITKLFAFPREKTFMDDHSPEPEGGIYLKEFEYVAVEEARNDSSYTHLVNGELTSWDLADIKKIKEKKDFGCFNANVILNYLASIGELPKGTYLVKVCW